MAITTEDPEAILATYLARRKTFEDARKAADDAIEPLLARYVAALFREKPGLNAVAVAAYQDYDSSQLRGHAYVRQHSLEDDAWGRAGFAGECPKNEIDRDDAEALEEELRRFLPTLLRKRGYESWCIAFWRDPSKPEGYATEEREHPGFD